MGALRGLRRGDSFTAFSHPRWIWLAIGLVAGTFYVAIQVAYMGGNPADILAGGDNALGRWVEERLGAGDLNEFWEHDGHRYFAVAEDLRGRVVPELMPDAAYRYQRILFPLVASAFGLLNGLPIMWGMIIVSVLAFAAASAGVARLAARLGLPAATPLALVANPAVWLGLQLLTADTLALTLFLWALVALLHERNVICVLLLVLACLTKEVYVIAAVSLSTMIWVNQRNKSLAIATFASTIPAFIWFLVLRLRMGGTLDSSNLGRPFEGIVDGVQLWPYVSGRDLFFGISALAFLGLGLLTLRHPRILWFWLCAPWIVVGVVTSRWVWGVGNNALRVVAPLTLFTIMAALDRRRGYGDRPAPVGSRSDPHS